MTDSPDTPTQDLLGPTDWASLKMHLDRGALLWVAPSLSLKEVVARIAADDVAQVATWLREKKLLKPGPELTNVWDRTPARSFNAAIVQPYVLIQEFLN